MKAVIRIKMVLAFIIPFFTALGGALGPLAMEGAIIPESLLKQYLLAVVISSAAIVAGGSGLQSFLSTSYSDYKAHAQASTNPPASVIVPTT